MRCNFLSSFRVSLVSQPFALTQLYPQLFRAPNPLFSGVHQNIVIQVEPREKQRHTIKQYIFREPKLHACTCLRPNLFCAEMATGYDYVALDPQTSSTHPFRKFAGVVGLVLSLAAVSRSRSSLFYAQEKDDSDLTSKPFYPQRGLQYVTVKPSVPGAIGLPPLSLPPSCLFTYGSLVEHETGSAFAAGAERGGGEEAWLYGAIRGKNDRLAHPTGHSSDVLKGQLLCWDFPFFADKLHAADLFWAYDPYSPEQTTTRRGVAFVVRHDGSAVKSYWHYQVAAGTGLPEPARWRQGKFWEWRGMDVRYAVVNPEGPKAPLLLIHGFGASLEHWRGNVEPLAKDRPVYAIDLLGFGFSAQPDYPKTFNRWGGHVWAQQLSDFTSQVIKRPTVLVGNSLGGYSALLTAAVAPQNRQVAGLVLVNSAGPFSPEGQKDPFFGEQVPQLSLELMDELPPPPTMSGQVGLLFKRALSYAGFIATRRNRIGKTLALVYTDDKSRVDADLVDLIKRPALQPNAYEVFFQTTVGGRGKPGINVRLLLQTIEKAQLPTALLWGINDPWITRKKADLMLSVAPSADFLPLRAGHCPHDEVPEQFNAELTKWLADKGL
eukprot:g59327.t1